jgi:hypothetical protein
MLYKSKINLEQGVIDFVNTNETITVYSAYIKLEELIKINSSNNIKQIIVRWEIGDLCLGVSDIELYDYCIQNKIALYRNTRIHLKTIWNNKSSVILGSANVTNRGLGESGNFNYELNGFFENISFEDQSYLNKIIFDSEYVTEKLYQQLKSIVDSVELPTFDYPDLPTPPPTVDYFLINQLPMSSAPLILFKIYSGTKLGEEEMIYAAHDLELYKIRKGLDEEKFLLQLSELFNTHPFIVAFKTAIKNSVDDFNRADRNNCMRFGTVRKWFTENTTTVPTPRSGELNEFVRVLYTWICFFDKNFTWNTPNHTQVISYRK